MERIVVVGRNARASVAALLEGATAARMTAAQLRPGMAPGADDFKGACAVFIDGIPSLSERWREYVRANGASLYIIELPRLRTLPGSDYGVSASTFGLYENTLSFMPRRMGNTAVVAGVLTDRTPAHALVCAQKPNDAAHGLGRAAIDSWAKNTVAATREHYGLPVVFRPHPHGTPVPPDAYTADAVSNPATESLRDAMRFAAVVVTHNSTSGIDAIDAGVPVLYTAEYHECAYSDYAQRLGEPIVPLSDMQRRVCLLRTAACTWTLDQLRDGTALRCLIRNEPWPEPTLVVAGEDVSAARRADALVTAADADQPVVPFTFMQALPRARRRRRA